MNRFIASIVAIVDVISTHACVRADEKDTFKALKCEGSYPKHLQGICTNGKDSVYWCFTDVLVKTDSLGKLQKKVPVADHHGDLCHHEGKVYVAVNLGQFNNAKGMADSWVYVYDAANLELVRKHKVPEVFHGAGGIVYHDGRFFVVGGLPAGVPENYVYEYDAEFRFRKKHVLESGHTEVGIQTAAFVRGHFWFGCYGGTLLKADAKLTKVQRYPFDASIGIVGIAGERFLVGRGPLNKGIGAAVIAEADEAKGLVVIGK